MTQETKNSLLKLSNENKEESLGLAVSDAVDEMDNSFEDIGSSIINVFLNVCENEEQLNVANRMLIAITGYGIETLLSRVEGGDSSCTN